MLKTSPVKSKKLYKKIKNGLKRGKTHFYTYKSSYIMLVSDVEHWDEFNGTNPRDKNLSSKKL